MKKNSQIKIIKRILILAGHRKFIMLLSILLSVLFVFSNLGIPVFIGRGIDGITAIGGVDMKAVRDNAFFVGALTVATAALQWVISFLNQSVVFAMGQSLRRTLFDRLHRLPLSYIDSHSHGDMISRMIGDIDRFLDGLQLAVSQLVIGILTILLTLVNMFLISPGIALLVVGVTPLSIFAAGFVARKSYVYFKDQSVAAGELTGYANEMIDGLSVVKGFSREAFVKEDFSRKNEVYKKASIHAVFFSSITNPSTRFVNAIVYAGVVGFGIWQLSLGRILAGSLVVFLSYAAQYAKPFNEISGVFGELQNAFACAVRVFEVLDEAEQLPDASDSRTIEDVGRSVAFENVDFSYQKDRPFIKNLSFYAKKGEVIAIVGPTGCGKSTLINLLMRFYEPDDGEILIDDRNIRDIKRSSLLSLYGMVLQETWLRNASIRENIAFSRPDADLDEIVQAAKEAGAHDFISAMPQGYDSLITENGENLSSGQRQLLCIARVMLSDARVLILDEATSSIDTRTELKISQALLRLMKGKTCFIVAHRLSTIREADRILVMQDGAIIERGSHRELMKKEGFYHTLMMSQFEG